MSQDYTPYQQKIINGYYRNKGAINVQKLGEIVTELFLAEGKKVDQLWDRAEKTMTNLEIPASRIANIMAKRDIKLLANLVTELNKT
ncbi:MAG: hypothetical protein R3B84_04905 [Zavarzinella sp.]